MPSLSPAPVALCALHTQGLSLQRSIPDWLLHPLQSHIDKWNLRPSGGDTAVFCALSLTTWFSSYGSSYCSQSSLTLPAEWEQLSLLCLSGSILFSIKPSCPLSSPPVVTVLICCCFEWSDFATACSTIVFLFSASLFVPPLPLSTSASPSGRRAIMLFRRKGGLMEPQPSLYYF